MPGERREQVTRIGIVRVNGKPEELDGIVLLGVPVLLAAATIAAFWIPALRAAKVDPTMALRQE